MIDTESDQLQLRREVSLPAEAKQKMRLHAASTGSTLGELVAGIIRTYADGKYDGSDGRINIAATDDPGPADSDGRVKFWIEESVWEAARIRTIMDETTLSSVVRRAAIALNR